MPWVGLFPIETYNLTKGGQKITCLNFLFHFKLAVKGSSN